MKSYKVFISYSHVDEKLCNQLINHLSSLKRSGIIKEWYDRKILAGNDWDKSIKQELIDSEIILLLISPDFIASDYCNDIEIKTAMEKHNLNTAIVIPVILRDCDWKDLPFSAIQGLPKDVKPIIKWDFIDEAFLDTVEGIKNRIKDLENIPDHISHSKPVETSDTEYIEFEKEIVLCLLPRGYIVLEDIKFQTYSSWAVVASYCRYDGQWMHGTHYHESYRRLWESLDGHYSQCRKLGIPKADSDYADTCIEIMMRLRERKEDESIEEIVELYSIDTSLNKYYPANTKIPKPVIPDQFKELNKNGPLRDIIYDLEISPWQNYKLETLHGSMESLRRKAILKVYELLPNNHPAIDFVKEIANNYNPEFTLSELTKWSRQLSDAINDTFGYIK